jgi:hypothetical protein
MRTNSWQTITTSKVLRVFFTVALVAFWTACADESQNLKGPDADAASKGSVKSGSSLGDYTLGLVVTENGSLWTYTITKASSASKNLSHFIINLGNCGDQSATFSDIDYATVNGVAASFVNTEGSGTTCDPQSATNNFVKIAGPFTSATSWVIVIKFDRGYEQFLTQGWIKAGTTCSPGTIIGPGCPITEYCSLSQGYYFANGSFTNGADEIWTAAGGLTIGSQNYTHTEASALWLVNTGKGGIDEMRAFFQLGALRLSDVAPAELASDMAIIESYFAALPKVVAGTCTSGKLSYPCFNLLPNADVKAAAGRIGTWISEHHCE